jgi:hypothetical protein
MGGEKLKNPMTDGIRLNDLIKEAELGLLFESSISAGLTSVSIGDGSGIILSCEADRPHGEVIALQKALYLEGEETGEIRIEGPVGNRDLVESIGELLYDAVRAILLSSYRTLLVAEARKAVASQSYEELIDRNARLAESESRYRRLSEELRRKMQKNMDIDPALGFVSENLRSIKKCLSGIRRVVSRSAGPETDRRRGKKAGERHLRYIEDADQLVKESIKNLEYIKGIISGSAEQPEHSGGGGKKRPGIRKKRSGGNNGKHHIDS